MADTPPPSSDSGLDLENELDEIDDDDDFPEPPQTSNTKPTPSTSKTSDKNVKNPEPQPSTSGRMTRSNSKAVPVVRENRKHKRADDLEHPYTSRMDAEIEKLHGILDQMYSLASNDLLVVDRDSGINVYDMNYKFADKLDSIGKVLITMQKKCNDEANNIRSKVDSARDRKLELQDRTFIEDVPRKGCPRQFDQEYVIIKKDLYATYVSSDSEVDEEGDWDTKFKYSKTNTNDVTNYVCNTCQQSYRDKRELRNHWSNHHKELYRCLKCTVICRSERSFYNHYRTHTGTVYTCKHCAKTFNLKMSLTNHLQKHNSKKLKCKLCGKEFQYRSTYKEHTQYRLHDQKSVKCLVCKKMYWTPTDMRSHRAKKHGLVTKMYRGAI